MELSFAMSDDLRALRKELGWTQQRLAEVLGITREQVSLRELGKVQIRPETIFAMKYLALEAGGIIAAIERVQGQTGEGKHETDAGSAGCRGSQRGPGSATRSRPPTAWAQAAQVRHGV